MKNIEVVAAIIKKDDKIFITRRGYGEFIDMWEFPGGKIEKGELREEALRREIDDELELKIEVKDLVTTIEYDYPNFHLIMHCFLCEVIGGELKLNAHNDAKWVLYDDLDNQKWVPADVLAVDELRKYF